MANTPGVRTNPNTTITIPDRHARLDYERVAVNAGGNPPSTTVTPPSEAAVAAGRTDSFSRKTYQWESLLGGRGRAA
jgi:hypothetical protein